MKKVLIFSAFLACLITFSPCGECKTPDSNIFEHNVKPPVQQVQSPIKTGNDFKFNNQNTNLKHGYFDKKITQKHHHKQSLNKHHKITKIGNKPVIYKNGKLHKIGEQQVIYAPNGKIHRIGSLPVVYENNQIQQIGSLPVMYGNDNEILRIGNWSVSYDG